MHSHIFIPSYKKDVSYCKICSQLAYKGTICQTIPLEGFNRFNIDPLKLKFRPISNSYKNKLPNQIKYLDNRNKGISKIKFLTSNFGLKSMILYRSICFMNQIYLENEVSIENIEAIASLCVLLVTEFNECCRPAIIEEYITENENDLLYHSFFINKHSNYIKKELLYNEDLELVVRHKSNLNKLFCYIKNNVNNFKYWEVLCLKYLNYNLGKYSAYDYLLLFFKLGIFFCEEEINIINKLKYCVKILDYVVNHKKSCDFSQYTFAMSIIKVALENDNFFDKKIFNYIYGVDLSKKKYINCSNLIKRILNISINIENSRNTFNILNNLLNYYQLNNQFIDNNIFINNYLLNNHLYFSNNKFLINSNIKKTNFVNDKKEKVKKQKKNIQKKIIDKYNNNNSIKSIFSLNELNPQIINNNNIIINNHININNFDLNEYFYNKCTNNNKINFFNFYNSFNNNSIQNSH